MNYKYITVITKWQVER